MVHWADLHGDMLTLIGEYLTDVNDNFAFSMVCSSWRSSALAIRPLLPLSIPLLMLPNHVNPKSKTRSYLSLCDQTIIEKKSFFPTNDVSIGSHGGWMIIVHKNLDMSLFNPFSEERLPLPPLTSIPNIEHSVTEVDNDTFVEVAALSSSDMRVSPNDLTVMIAWGTYRLLAFAKSGDSHWQVIENDQYYLYTNIAFYKGKFYAIGDNGTVECDLSSKPSVKLVAPEVSNYLTPSGLKCYKWYLVESLGELMLVSRWMHTTNHKLRRPNNNRVITVDFGLAGNVEFGGERLSDRFRTYKTVFFTVYKMDFISKEWKQVKDLCNQTYFLGHNTAFSMSTNKCKGNCIYFTEDNIEYGVSTRRRGRKDTCYGCDMGLFDFADGSIKPFFNMSSKVYYPTPLWAIYRPW